VVRRFGISIAAIALASCAGGVADSTIGAVDISNEDKACVDFYRSMQESVEEEQLYYVRLAERIEQLGHADAAVILHDLAEQWEIGYWAVKPCEEAPELAMSAQLAETGALLRSEGHISKRLDFALASQFARPRSSRPDLC
jgi:hypothetical protein